MDEKSYGAFIVVIKGHRGGGGGGGGNKITSSKDIVYDFCNTGGTSTPHTPHPPEPLPSHPTPNLMATSLVTAWSHVYSVHSLQFILFNLIGKTNYKNIHLTRHISPGLVCY